MKFLRSSFERILIILFISIFVSACGVWKDFTTYFNLYYNTKVAYEKAEEEITRQPRDIFEFKEEPVTALATQNLTKVIEKCSKILQYDSESSYFNDALFMIGKAFYFQQSYSRAIRKFLEILSQDNNSLSLEAELWLGKSKLQMREFDEGLEVLENVKIKAIEQGEEEIYNEASIRQISYYIYRENYTDAITKCEEFVKTTNDDEFKSVTFFKLGELHFLEGDYDKSIAAYRLVNEYAPSIELQFRSQFEASKVLYKNNNYDESLVILRDLFNEDKFEEFYGLVQTEIGINYYSLNRIEEAKNIFIEVDSTYSQNEVAGISDYYLGKIWEYKLANYDSAKFYYKLASISAAPQEYKDSTSQKVEMFERYFFLKQEYFSNSKSLMYNLDSEAFIRDSVLYAEYEVRLKDYLETKRLEDEALKANNTNIRPTDLGVSSTDNSINEIGNDGSQLGGRRSTTSTTTTTTQSTGIARGNTASNNARLQLKKNDLPTGLEKVFRPIKSNLSVDSLTSLIAKNLLDLGNLFFTDFNLADSTDFYYMKIINNYPGHRVYPNALFALGSFYLTQNRKAEADSLFQIIYDQYSQSAVHTEAAKKLGLWKDDTKNDRSKELYLTAEEQYFNNKVDSAIVGWYNIVKDHPSSEYAPKALFTIGFILENDKQLLDSAAFVYSHLAELYGNTDYAGRVKGKLEIYKKEKGLLPVDSTKQQSASISIPDSLSILKETLPDSAKVPQRQIIEDRDLLPKRNRVNKKERDSENKEGVIPEDNSVLNEDVELERDSLKKANFEKDLPLLKKRDETNFVEEETD